MEILRRAQFKATAWKNGGGITHEAIRVPAAGEAFRWRVSIARIDASGPFSDFSGYHRAMLLLKGAGISLAFSDGTRTYLRNVGDIVEFDGALSAECELLDGPCEDLNVMVSQEQGPARVSVERLAGRRSFEPPVRETSLIVVLEGEINLTTGESPSQRLEPGDLAVIYPDAAQVMHVEAPDPAVSPLVLYASIDDAA